MTDYRIVVKHVRYWRGAIHRWSTSYPFTGSGAAPTAANCHTLLSFDQNLCYPGPTGSINGGTYECVAYRASGGTPVATYTAFDWTSPGAWVRDTGAGWTAFTAPYERAAETALLVEWPAGTSSSGKPVSFRKWYHAVEVSTASTPGAVDVSSALVGTLQTAAENVQQCLEGSFLYLGNAGRSSGLPTVSAYYGNHQMPKGRKRKALVTAGGKYTGPTIVVPDVVVQAD